MVNRALLTHEGVIAPGLVIGTFDREATMEEMLDLIDRLETIDEQPVSPETKAAVHQLYADMVYRPNRLGSSGKS